MDNDVLLSTLLKLVGGDKERCFQLVKTIRSQYPAQSMQWYINKAIYDMRFGKKNVKPNTTLSRWGEGGGNFAASPPPAAQTIKPSSTLPPPPPPNLALSTPQPKTSVPSVLPDFAALAKAKRQPVTVQPANARTKQKLDSLTKDQRVSERLVGRLQLDNPHRSAQWCWEKAIYDLERDRL